VSTDSTDIAEEARTAGAQVHWRSLESATDFAPSIVGVQDFCLFHPGF
jgi:CMP-N-acetylneuraminic acid synthetase